MKKKPNNLNYVIIVIIFSQTFFLSQCDSNIRNILDDYNVSFFLYIKPDNFGRKNFFWEVQESELTKLNSTYYKVFYNNNDKQIIRYEKNNLYLPDHERYRPNREFINKIEKVMWYSIESIVVLYKGLKTYFLQERISKPNEIGFFYYDEKGRLIRETVYDKNFKQKRTNSFIYNNEINPVKRIEEQLVSEEIKNNKIIKRLKITTYHFSDELIINIEKSEIIQNN